MAGLLLPLSWLYQNLTEFIHGESVKGRTFWLDRLDNCQTPNTCQKAASNIHKLLRQKHGYQKLDQMTTDQLPLVLADVKTCAGFFGVYRLA